MRIVPGDACAELLRYDTSGNMTSDWSHSVSYAALSFRAAGDGPAHDEPDDDTALRSGDRAWLLNLARESIRSSLDKQEPPVAPPEDSPPIFRAERATFVTLKIPDRDGFRLRGCIGNMEPYRPLYRSVFENARKAAFSDPRFDPLERQELDRTRIEISVLTPMRPVADPSEIVPGRDGVQLRRSGRTAVFLPQVATEQGWDRIALLENLCRKAGLAQTAWKKAELLVFQAIVFGEDCNDGVA
jgi:AmmeMemoRadiSam system protein A